jgi:hypothetical protein
LNPKNWSEKEDGFNDLFEAACLSRLLDDFWPSITYLMNLEKYLMEKSCSHILELETSTYTHTHR